jgi:hypothetical protein
LHAWPKKKGLSSSDLAGALSQETEDNLGIKDIMDNIIDAPINTKKDKK